MPQHWEVVGGSDKGGILVRAGEGLKSAAIADRLATGAVIEELQLKSDRLQYRLVTGTGPATGWVSTKITGKELVVKTTAPAAGGAAAAGAAAAPSGAAAAAAATNGAATGPADTAGPVEVDADLKKKIEAMAEEKKKAEDFPLYLMKYKMLGYPLEKPKLRILCFHNAGSAESNYTAPNTPLTAWSKESKEVEICAFDYPGRDKLLKRKKHESIETLAPELLAIFHEKMSDGVPYVLWGHSVGTWVGFEFLMHARKIGLPMPIAAFFHAFPAPHLPEAKRNWHKNRGMGEKQFKEELLNWDKEHFGGMGKVVFDEPAWNETWMPLMRSDFCLFDEYVFRHGGAPKFDFPIHAWHFDQEHYNTQDQVELWGEWTTGKFDHQVMRGMGHLTCVYKPDQKKAYFTKMVDAIKAHAGL